MKNIILIGFMGTGKTTIATKLSHRLKMDYASTDTLIENKEKRTINEIFRDSGEDYFRDVESAVIRELCSLDNQVIDAGGGAVLRGENWDSFRRSGIVICLAASEEEIFKRTKKYKHRPLLNVEHPKLKIRELLRKRAPFYAKADHTIDTGELTVSQVVERIVEIAEAANKEASA